MTLHLCVAAVWVFLFSQFLHAGSQYNYTLAPDMDFYFAHISYREIRKDGNDVLVFREGSLKPELAVLDLPIGPGDTIRTTGQEINPCRAAFKSYQRNELIASAAESSFSGISALESRVFRGKDSFSSPSISRLDEGRMLSEARASAQKTSEESQHSSSTPDAAKIGSMRTDQKVRFRDWNPDLDYARRTGAATLYSSRTNEVFCPNLGISSRGIVDAPAGRIRNGGARADRSLIRDRFS